MKKIYIVTTSRADRGCLKYVIEEMKSQNINYCHINFNIIHREEFTDIMPVEKENEIKINIRENIHIYEIISEISSLFGMYCEALNIRNILILGDRWETLVIATIARLYNVTIFHQGGGEQSGCYDDYYRKAITQLSDYHFVVTEKCKINLMYQGMKKEQIYICGSPRLDNDKSKLKKIKYKNKTGLVIYHPTTHNQYSGYEIKELIEALKCFDMDYIIIYPNFDKGSKNIIQELKDYSKKKNVKIIKKMELDDYYNILNSVDVMIGNSSAGIMEAASYNIPVVNIGERQKNRECNANVLHSICEREEIKKCIDYALNDDFVKYCKTIKNKFSGGKSSKKIVEIIKEIIEHNYSV